MQSDLLVILLQVFTTHLALERSHLQSISLIKELTLLQTFSSKICSQKT